MNGSWNSLDQAFGSEFRFFVNEGSCDGESWKLYPIRICKENIPQELIPYYPDFNKLLSEKELCADLMYLLNRHLENIAGTVASL